MYRKAAIVFIVLFSIACGKDNSSPTTGTNGCDYELLPETSPWEKPYLPDHFVSIALGSEYQDGRPVVRKWLSPMRVFVGGSPKEELIEEINRVISEINVLASDGFTVEMVQDSARSNLYMYFGVPEVYKNRFPEVQHNFNNQDGFFVIKYDASSIIHSAHLFVNTTTTLLETQKHLLREELTQCLGLPNDITYTYSIFHDKPSSTTYYAAMDKEIIRLLYHPAIRPGIGEESVRKTIKQLLCLP